MGPFQIGDTPFQGNVILNIDFWRRLWTRFGTTKERAPQKMFFLISMKWSAEKGIRRIGSQVPVNTFLSLAACTSLPCMFSLTPHLNFAWTKSKHGLRSGAKYIIHFNCKRYPPSLPYIMFVQTCGKRWGLSKFVDVHSVNLGISRLLIWSPL